MEKKYRKQNRLAGYDYSQPGAYFITVCTENRKCLLSTIVGADDHIGPQVQLSPVGRVVEHFLQQMPGIAEFVIMPNHVHMILQISTAMPGNGPMWSSAPTNSRIENTVRTWKTLITKALGYRIWQRSYYDHIIRSEEEYIKIAEYIIGNPGKWLEDKYYCL